MSGLDDPLEIALRNLAMAQRDFDEEIDPAYADPDAKTTLVLQSTKPKRISAQAKKRWDGDADRAFSFAKPVSTDTGQQKLIGPKRPASKAAAAAAASGDTGEDDEPDAGAPAPKTPAKKKSSVIPVATVDITGVFPGETATMTESKTLTARFRVVRGYVPPSEDAIKKFFGNTGLTHDELLALVYERVRHRRGPHFVSPAAVFAWLKTVGVSQQPFDAHGASISGYQFISQNPANLRIRFETLKPKDPKLIAGENIGYILGNDLHPWDVTRRFTAASDSTANTHGRRLVLLAKYYTLDTGQKPLPQLVNIRTTERHNEIIINEKTIPMTNGYTNIRAAEDADRLAGRPVPPYAGALNFDKYGRSLKVPPDETDAKGEGNPLDENTPAAVSHESEQDMNVDAQVKAGLVIYDLTQFPARMFVSTGQETLGGSLVHRIDGNNECYIRFESSHISGEQAIELDAYHLLYEPQMRGRPSLLSEEQAKVLRDRLQLMSSSVLKSLMQKIIRRAARNIQTYKPDSEEGIYGAENVLIWVMIVIMSKAPTFNPVTSTQERGIHAVMKRVFIACVEDAWPADVQPVKSLLAIESAESAAIVAPVSSSSLSASALAPAEEIEAVLLFGFIQLLMIGANRSQFWPSIKQLSAWITLARMAWRSKSTWRYDSVTETEQIARPSDILTAGNQMKTVSYLLDTFVHGMNGDKLMTRDVARKVAAGNYDLISATEQWPIPASIVMPVWHALDQHDLTTLIYLFDPKGEVMRVTRSSGSIRTAKPMSDLFRFIFSNMTGLNPRRENLGIIDLYGRGVRKSPVSDAFIDEVAQAQAFAWRLLVAGEKSHSPAKQSNRDPRKPVSSASASSADAMDQGVQISLALPFAWLAYAFGTHTHRAKVDKKNYLYNISPSDLSVHFALKEGRVTKESIKKTVRTVGSGTEEALHLEQRNNVIRQEIIRSIIYSGVRTEPGVFTSGAAGYIKAARPPGYDPAQTEDDSLIFSVTRDRIEPARPWSDSYTTEVIIRPVELENYIRPGNFSAINEFAYLNSVNGWDANRTIPAIREAVKALGVSPAAILDAVSQLRSFSLNINFPQPARDGGASDDELPSFMQIEVCQIVKVVAAFCPAAIHPIAWEGTTRLNKFTTESAYLMLRRMIGAVIDPALLDTPIEDLMMDRVRPLISSRRLNVMLEQMRAVWKSSKGNQLWLHQQQCVEKFAVRVCNQGLRSHFLDLPPGGGKTDCAVKMFQVLLYLLRRRSALEISRDEDDLTAPMVGVNGATDGLFMLLTTTNSAIGTVFSLVSSVLGPSHVTMLIRARGALEMPRPLRAGHAYIIKHDDLRDFSDQFIEHMPRAFFVVDEVHMATGKTTKRTAEMLALSRVSMYTVAMTGTPLRGTREKTTLMRWIQQGTKFPCMKEDEFVVALSDIITYPVISEVKFEEDGTPVNRYVEIATNSRNVDVSELVGEEQNDAIWANLPRHMGGTHDAPTLSVAMFEASFKASRQACTAHIVAECVRDLAGDTTTRPFIVAQNMEHVREFHRLLTEAGVNPALIFAHGITNADTMAIGLTTLSSPSAYRVCLMPLFMNTGYPAVWFNKFYSAVYPSSADKREQIIGRIVRTGQVVSPIDIIIFHAGLTTLMFVHHVEAGNVNKLIKELNNIKNQINE